MTPTKSTSGGWLNRAITWVKQGSPGTPAAADAAPVDVPPPESGERRRNKRVQGPFDAVLSLAEGSLPVQGIDLHKGGARVLSPVLLPPGSVVFIHLKATGLVGFAHVRHCNPCGRQAFAVGFEFPSELMPGEQGGAWRYERIQAK